MGDILLNGIKYSGSNLVNVDNVLDKDSNHPVSNKAVSTKIEELEGRIATGGGGGGTPYDDTDIKNDLQALTTRVGTVETDKANASEVYTKTEVDDAIAQAQIGGTADLSDYAKTADVDLKLADKANKTELDAYTKTDDLTNLLADKADKTDLDDLVTSTEMQDAIVQAQIGGAAITVDDVMSDDSTNPVQNKITKKYVDDAVIGMTAGSNFLTENGFGKLRYYDNKFQYYDDGTSDWVDTIPNTENSVVINLIPGNVRKFITVCNPDTLDVEIKLEEPIDVVNDGQILCFVDKVIVVRKKDSVPTDENDGVRVFTVDRNEFGKYKDTPFIDSFGGMQGDVYYYKAFPVGHTGLINYMSENNRKCIIKNYQVYGFRIDQTEGEPSTMIQYLEDVDNANFIPAYMDYKNDRFNYSDWEEAWFIKNLKPCMLNYDGTVAYELNKNDYTLKADGSPSDITDANFEGNVMVGIPKTYWKIIDNGDDTADVYFSNEKLDDEYVCWCNINEAGEEIDYFYMAAYNSNYVNPRNRSLSGKNMTHDCYQKTDHERAIANNIAGQNAWNLELFIDRQLINLLLLLIGKTTDTQTAFGRGYDTYGGKTGLLDKKGLFYGRTESYNIKVFGIENYWGNEIRHSVGCMKIDGVPKVKFTHTTDDGSTGVGYNLTADGYIELPNNVVSADGYIFKMSFTNNILFPKETTGSATTSYCDYYKRYNSGTRFAAFGGYTDTRKGAFFCDASLSTSSFNDDVGSAISCKPLNTP